MPVLASVPDPPHTVAPAHAHPHGVFVQVPGDLVPDDREHAGGLLYTCLMCVCVLA